MVVLDLLYNETVDESMVNDAAAAFTQYLAENNNTIPIDGVNVEVDTTATQIFYSAPTGVRGTLNVSASECNYVIDIS